MKYLWLGGAVLLAVAAGATWIAFGNPTFITGLVAASVAALGRAVWPWVRKLLGSKGSAEARQRLREGQQDGKDGGR